MKKKFSVDKKIEGSIPVWGSETFSGFAKAWVAKKLSFNLPSCKSLDIYKISYITIFLRRIQRLQICKISTDIRGTLM